MPIFLIARTDAARPGEIQEMYLSAEHEYAARELRLPQRLRRRRPGLAGPRLRRGEGGLRHQQGT
jgi:hypothetical protein